MWAEDVENPPATGTASMKGEEQQDDGHPMVERQMSVLSFLKTVSSP